MAHAIAEPPSLPPRPAFDPAKTEDLTTTEAISLSDELGVVSTELGQLIDPRLYEPKPSALSQGTSLKDSQGVQEALYAESPIIPDRQIRILELLPGELGDEVRCNLTVQDVDLKTRRVPPSHAQRDLIGDMLSLGFVDFLRKNVTKDGFIRDIKKWMPKTYQERQRQSFIEAHAAASAHPTFNALSYTWGTWADSTTIQVNGRDGFPVTRNLWSALRRMRSTTNINPLWVDQICINQQDDVEKACQVQAMGNIYSIAWDVHIWLGDVPDDAPPPEQTTGPGGRRAMAEQLLQAMDAAEPTWWTRTWCIQEFIMARQDPLTCFGGCQMRWTEVAKLGKRVKDDTNLKLSKIREDWNSTLPRLPKDPLDDVSVPFFNFMRIKYMAKVRGLASMGWAYSQTQATNPLDKVYSLLGLIDPAESAMITVDYNKDPAWVFAEATYASIVASGNINILHLVKQNKSDLTLPSWVVDFSYASKAISHDWIGTQDFSQYLFDKESMPWCRIQDRNTAKALITVKRRSLVLTGLHFDIIVRTVRYGERSGYDFHKYWGEMSQTARDLLKAPLGLFSDQPVTLTKNEKAIFQSVLDIVGSSSPYTFLSQHKQAELPCSPISDAEVEEDDTEKAVMLSFRLFDVWTRRFLRGHVSGLTKVAWRQYGMWKLYFRDLSHGDTFYVTRNGFIGLGHKDCQVGDVVALPYGSRHPVLLHPDEEQKRYNFFGFTYVNGIMNDELRQVVVPDLVLEEKEFILV